MEKTLLTDLTQTVDLLKAKFHNNLDVTIREFLLTGNTRAAVLYIHGIVDSVAQRDLLDAIFKAKIPEGSAIDYLCDKVVTTFGCLPIQNLDFACRQALAGDTVLFVDGEDTALAIATAMWTSRSIGEPPASTIVSGPREGFTEDLKLNITQIRRRLQTPDLVIERFTVGRYSNSDVALIYLGGIADSNIVEKVRKRILKIDIDAVLDVNYIQQYLEEKRGSIFKQAGSCEKPDIVCAKVLEGRVAIMVNGSPIAITIPYLALEDFQQSEDYYTRPSKAIFLRALRVVAVIVGVLLPGFYVSVQVYHYNIIPVEYVFTLMNAVQGLPMKPLMEIITVIILFEIIHEASFRMPRYVGMAMSIVGALVLGDTAVKAGLMSTPAIMFVALSSIALYTVPDSVGTFRLLRVVFTLLAGLSGFFGLIAGGIFLSAYISKLDSYGAPYLAPFAPLVKEDIKDSLYLVKHDEYKTRPSSIPNINQTRTQNNDDNN